MSSHIITLSIGCAQPDIGKNIAAFDFDGTLVKVKNTRTAHPFPKNKDDWVWFTTTVPDRLRQLHQDGFSIIVFTNQTKLFKLDMIREALTSLDIPLTAFISFRKAADKPNPKMFHDNVPSDFDPQTSFYVGDAAGRPGDWSDMDRVFADAIGIRFQTPEDFFGH